MEIIDNRKQETTIQFDSLKIGDTFRRKHSTEVYMKTENFYDTFDDGWYVDRRVAANAFSLNNGKRMKVYSDEQVIPLTCKCIITDNRKED